MAKPYFYRWTDEQAAAVEAERVRIGAKTTKEVMDALVATLQRIGRIAADAGAAAQPKRQAAPAAEKSRPAYEVAVYDPKARRATPKAPKGKR